VLDARPISSEEKTPLKDTACPDGSKPVRHLQQSYLLSKIPNDRNWINVPVKRFTSLEKALDVVCDTILFEAVEMRMLRIDDHIYNLVEACSCTVEDAANNLLLRLANMALNHEEIDCYQITFFYEETLRFLQTSSIPFGRLVIYPVENDEEFRWSIAAAMHLSSLEEFLSYPQDQTLAKSQQEKIVAYVIEGLDYFERICRFYEELPETNKKDERIVSYIKALKRKIIFYLSLIEHYETSDAIKDKIQVLNVRLSILCEPTAVAQESEPARKYSCCQIL
jgi:hypothetical protein